MIIKHAILSDIHFPLHNQKAISTAVRFLNRYPVKNLHLLGDCYDLAPFSRFLTQPSEQAAAAQVLVDGKRFLDDLIERISPDKAYFYIGNHEERLSKYLLRNAPALIGVVGYQALKPDKAELVEHRWGQDLKGVRFMHGGLVRKNPGATPLEHVRAFRQPVVVGHSHRLSVVWDRELWCAECGHLSQPDAHEYCTTPPNWTQGFVIIDEIGPRTIKLE